MFTCALLLFATLPEIRLDYYDAVKITAGDYVVTLENEPFDVDQSRMGRDGHYLTVDGSTHFGVGRNKPETQLRSIRATYQGKDMRVGKELWQHVYALDLGRGALKRFENGVELTEEGIVLKLIGGDGGVAYQLVLTLRKDGKHAREFSGI